MKNSALLFSFMMMTILSVPIMGQTSGYDILNIDFSARSASMAGAYTAVKGDIQSILYNPAGLADVSTRSVSISYLDHVLDINSGNFICVLPREDRVYAASVSYINYGDFEGRDIFGNDTGQFGAQDVFATFSAAQRFNDRFQYGISLKTLYSKIDTYSSTVAAVDAGVVYLIPDQQVRIGLSIANVGFVADSYQDTKDDVPTALKLGFSKYLAHLPLMVSGEYRRFLDSTNQFLAGGEFTFSEYVRGRVGFNSYGLDQKIDGEGSKLTGISFGFGFYWKKYNIDYAFSSMGIIGNLNRFTLVYLF